MKDLGKYYKSKYLALRAQYIKTIDFAFQEGYVKGQEDAQLQNMQSQVQDAQMQAQQAQAMQAGGGMPQEGAQPGGAEQGGAPGQPPGAPQEAQGAPQGMSPETEGAQQEAAQAQAQGQMPPEGGMYANEGAGTQEIEQLINTLQEAIQKSEIEVPSLQKSLDKLQHMQNQKKSMSYANNLSPTGKLALSEQEKLVQNLIKKWDSESSNAASEIMSSLRSESLK